MEATTKQKPEAIVPSKEHVFLDGPKSRGYELLFAWRVFKQFIKGFRTLHFIGPCITVFGSARFRDYLLTHEAARIQYEQLKYAMAEEANQDRKRYAALKEIKATAFITDILEKAGHNKL